MDLNEIHCVSYDTFFIRTKWNLFVRAEFRIAWENRVERCNGMSLTKEN